MSGESVDRDWNGPGSTFLYGLTFDRVWSFLTSQSASFWLVNLYLFFEYVRPQSIYRPIYAWPLGFWSIVLCLAAWVIEGMSLRRPNIADAAMAGFSGVLLASSIVAYQPELAWAERDVFLTWILVYFLITNIINSERKFLIFVLGFILYSLKMSQHAVRSWAGVGFDFRTWGAAGAPGWFTNSGEFAIQMVVLLPVSYYFALALHRNWGKLKRWFFYAIPASAVVGVMASSSRGSQLACIGVVLWMAVKSRKRVKALGGILLFSAAFLILLPQEQRERFSNIGEDETSQSRLTYWRHGIEITNDHPVLGIGYGNWLRYYRSRYNPAGQEPHNILIEAGAELGYLGLLAFAGLIAATLVINGRTRKLAQRLSGRGRFLWYMAHALDAAMIGYLAAGLFVTVLYYPFFWINLAFTVSLHTAARRKLRAWKRRTADTRGRREGRRRIAGAGRGALVPPASIPKNVP